MTTCAQGTPAISFAPRRVTVVVPFFQRKPGLLARALRSVAHQRFIEAVDVRVIVVDDASPLPAREELRQEAIGIDLSIIEQENAGPGAARNRALDATLADPPEFVAFLDSDDVWHADHLQVALTTLGQTSDFYFCNHRIEGETTTAFEKSKLVSDWLHDALGNAGPLRSTSESSVYEFCEGSPRESFIASYIAHTSGVVYRMGIAPHLRFDEQLRTAGEDSMFWIDLSETARNVRLSTEPRLTAGFGENIYFSSLDWASPNAHRRHAYSLLFGTKLVRRTLSERSRRLVKERMRRSEAAFVYLLARRTVIDRRLDLAIVRAVVRARPSLLMTAPFRFATAFSRRAQSRFWQ